MENQEETIQEEGSNRGFVILVAVLGGLLVLGIGAFLAWAFLIAPGMRADIEARNEAIFATNTAVAIAARATETAAAIEPTPSDTPVPTDTPPPTDTPTLPPPTPTSEVETPEPTPTISFETPEPGDENGDDDGVMPDTGIGILGGAVLAGGLALVLLLVRRLRSTT